MEDKRTFGAIIREERERRKHGDPEFSLRKFAAKVGISPTFLSKIETDEFAPPSAENIKKMAEYLEIDQNMLLAKANKIDPDLTKIITKQPVEIANFLRTVDGLSKEKLKEIADIAEKMKEED